MTIRSIVSGETLAGGLLILGTLLMLGGVSLWMGRNIYSWTSSGSIAYLAWERGLIAASIAITLLGFVLLESLLTSAGDLVWARLGIVTCQVAAVLGITAESFEISSRSAPYALVVAFVVLAFLGQAFLGLSLLQTELLTVWLGWVMIGWNLAALIILPIISPHDIYYPVAHQVAPLLLGIVLLVRR